MLNQFENENQGMHQTHLSDLEASKQELSELSDEQLEQVAGGIIAFLGSYTPYPDHASLGNGLYANKHKVTSYR